ncbi:MAG TPA: rhomboid family intramembrane serine protease [Anaerolineales bacterium]|nr:rhomboid family intramembrane serine protease [Anaerolineales bacterium]
MIPIRDTITSKTFPLFNWLLIVANTLVFLFEISLSPQTLEQFINSFGVIPQQLSLLRPWALVDNPTPLVTLLTHMFLHGGWVHFLSNMWILFIFGDNVEARMGHGRYLVFYLLGGIIAGITQAVIAPASNIPAIGASGAIAGVLGAYLVLFPHSRVVTLVPIFFFFWFIDIPAIFYLGFWFISQIFSGLMSLPTAGLVGGVAWWAHIGGFAYGIFLHRLFVKRIPKVNYYQSYN